MLWSRRGDRSCVLCLGAERAGYLVPAVISL